MKKQIEKIVVSEVQTKGFMFKHHVYVAPPSDSFTSHAHSAYEFLYFVDGDATQIIDDRRYKLKKGMLSLIRPSNHHYVRIDSPKNYDRYVINFDNSYLKIDNLGLLPENFEVVNCEKNAIIYSIFTKLDYYASHFDAETFTDIAGLLIKELVYAISLETDVLSGKSSDGGTHPLIQKAVAYINANLFNIKSVSEISDRFFVSESYLFKVFKKELKTSPKKYINDKKLIHAQDMIRRGGNPTEVCAKCGFVDYSAFYKSYVKLFGHRPSMESAQPVLNVLADEKGINK
ncbi:MAG: AraC family transcriptional regulator [Clostridia bacterium]|nr:AraC family transcriptional regulator [Clostridia bacterium]